MSESPNTRSIRVPGPRAAQIASRGAGPVLHLWTGESTVSPSGIHGRTFRRLSQAIVGFVALFADDPDDADDWSQSILIDIAERRGGPDPRFLESPNAAIAWIRTAVQSKKIDRFKEAERRQRREGEYGATVDAPRYAQLTPETELEEQVLRSAIERALAELPEVRRQVLLSVRERGNSYRQTATELGLKEYQVKYHLGAAQSRIRECLRGLDLSTTRRSQARTTP